MIRSLLLLKITDKFKYLLFDAWFCCLVQVFVACDMADVHKQATQEELWERIGRDSYMMFAVQEAFDTLRIILDHLLVHDQGGRWYAPVFVEIVLLCFITLCF